MVAALDREAFISRPQEKSRQKMSARFLWPRHIRTFGEGPTGDKWIAGVCFGAAADRCQAPEIAVGAHAARSLTRILADAVDAGGPTRRTVPVAVALGPTLRIRTANVAGRTLAHGPVAARHLAVRPLAALVAGTDALVGRTVLLSTALGVVLAFVATSGQGISLGNEMEKCEGSILAYSS